MERKKLDALKEREQAKVELTHLKNKSFTTDNYFMKREAMAKQTIEEHQKI